MATAIRIIKPVDSGKAVYWYPAESANDWKNCPSFAIQPEFVKSMIADPATTIEFVNATNDSEGNLVSEVIEVLKEPA